MIESDEAKLLAMEEGARAFFRASPAAREACALLRAARRSTPPLRLCALCLRELAAEGLAAVGRAVDWWRALWEVVARRAAASLLEAGDECRGLLASAAGGLAAVTMALRPRAQPEPPRPTRLAALALWWRAPPGRGEGARESRSRWATSTAPLSTRRTWSWTGSWSTSRGKPHQPVV